MEILVKKIDTKGDFSHFDLVVKKYTNLIEKSDLLIVKESLIENERFIEFYKIQFIATCETTTLENEIIAAFYTEKDGTLKGYVLSTLPDGYDNLTNYYIIDYKSYCDTCRLIGENTLSLNEYYDEIKNVN